MTSVVPLFQVDAFARKPFSGNPAAVCLLEAEADPVWMQSVAEEMNLSETAFVHRLNEGFGIRWFTPTTEVDLCGHSTLAATHILWQEGWLAADETAQFQSRSSILTATRSGGLITLDFPATPAEPVPEPEGLTAALGIQPASIHYNGIDYLVHLDEEAALHGLIPDFTALKQIKARGIIVTARSRQSNYDFISRFFGPAAGINEDPVTGSAHCTLGPWWGERLGKTSLKAYQASARGGEVLVELLDGRVQLSGPAVTTVRGSLYPDPYDSIRLPVGVSGIDHLVLTVRDIDTTCTFYEKALGMSVITFGDNRKALAFGTQKINLHQQGSEFEPKAETPVPGSADLCFVTKTPLDEAVTHITGHGIDIIAGPVTRTGAQSKLLSFYFRDPDGNLIELANELPPSDHT